MKNSEITNSNPLSDEVKINLNVFHTLMLNRIGGHADSADIVAIYQRGTTKRGAKLLKKLAQPGSLGNSIGHCAILSLGAGSRDSRLTLGRPRDEVVAKKHSIARGGLARIWTTGPISISIDHRIQSGGWSQQETQIKSALEIAQDALQCHQVRFPGNMHVKTDLLDSISNIWPGESQVLQGTS
jgi:hypothetical protein